MTVADIKFIRHLKSVGSAVCRSNPPAKGIQALVDAGYCRLSPTLLGPLGIRTGEVSVLLSEAGEHYINSLDKNGTDRQSNGREDQAATVETSSSSC